jgi:hypothetical protein
VSRILSVLLLLSFNTLAAAAVVSIDQTVDGRDNLFYTDWGHWYTTADDNVLGNPDSNPAKYIAVNGVAFNFAGFSSLTISASGMVVDHSTTATGPNGDPCNPTCLFNDGNINGLHAYSLIGMWSSTVNSITPIGNAHTAPFVVGSSALLNIPSLTSVYLFLAENDRGFGDNSGFYNVHLTATSAVPVPGALPLFASALIGAGLIGRRKRIA